jgi:hypothetical protein
LKPEEYTNCTLEQVFFFIKAYRQRRLEEFGEQWRQARFIAFNAVGPYLKKGTSIYDLLRLPGDPTPQELKAMREKELNDIIAESNRIMALAREKKMV